MSKCESYESRKKYEDAIWLNPKLCNNGQSAEIDFMTNKVSSQRLPMGNFNES